MTRTMLNPRIILPSSLCMLTKAQSLPNSTGIVDPTSHAVSKRPEDAMGTLNFLPKDLQARRQVKWSIPC